MLARNVRVGRGEIDIVAFDGATLVFVEVKSRRRATARELTGFENLDVRKLSALRRACGLFRKRLRPPPESYRLDVVVVDFPPAGAAPAVRWVPAVLDLDAS